MKLVICFLCALLAVVVVGVIYLKMAFWGTVIMSAAKPVSHSCGITWQLEKLPLFTGDWFCPDPVPTPQ